MGQLAYVRGLLLVLGLFLTGLVSGYAALSDENLLLIPGPGNDFDINTGSIMAPILQPRVPGTPGSEAVRRHLVDFFRTNLPEWRIDLQNSTFTTPTSNGKEVPFSNIILTRDPPGSTPGNVGRLALVAHYDSLSTIDGFIGATDSGAPCAMLLHAARSIDGALSKMWASGDTDELDEEKGIQILLLDGEEAFKSWTATDSIYGARALAEEWEATLHPAASTYHNNISNIDMFVLFDLLGAKNPRVPSYFLPTHWAYQSMATLEKRLRELNLFKSGSGDSEHLFFPDSNKVLSSFRQSPIGDDHIPFLDRGVEVLHIIPSPFPAVWHQPTDDGEHLDMDTVEDWTKLIIAFAAEWMELDAFMSPPRAGSKSRREAESKPGHDPDEL